MLFKDDFENLLKTKIKCIWINSYEEEKVMAEIKSVVASKFPGMKIQSWSFFLGLKEEKLANVSVNPQDYKGMPPDVALRRVFEAQCSSDPKDTSVWIFKDGHMLSDIKPFIRGVRDLKEISKVNNYNPIVVIAPITDIPIEQEKLWTVINYDTPNEQELYKLLQGAVGAMQRKNVPGMIMPDDDTLRRCARLAVGLTLNQAKEYIAKSFRLYNTISEEMFFQARIDLINKTGVLEYSEAKVNLEDMGGNHNFKNWIMDIKDTFSKEAEEFGVEKSKGFLALGVPGTSKTMSAEIISSEFKKPLLKFNMAKVMHSHVGQSEKNMENVIKIVKSCAPCVLLIDEAEKTLSGTGSSNQTDGGTLMRVVGQLLQFLGSEDSKDVFTIMTSNDVSQLPPELTRSGRLDTMWYFGLPKEDERKEIFNIHFKNRNRELSDSLLEHAALCSENLTGAEIKEAVKVAIRKSFVRFKKDGDRNIKEEDIDAGIREIIPVFNSSREKIAALENYAKNRARFANEEDRSTSINRDNGDMSAVLSVDDI